MQPEYRATKTGLIKVRGNSAAVDLWTARPGHNYVENFLFERCLVGDDNALCLEEWRRCGIGFLISFGELVFTTEK